MSIAITKLENEYREKKEMLIGKFRALDEKAEAEQRDLNSEEKAEAGRYKEEIAGIKKAYEAKRSSLEQDENLRKEFRDFEGELRRQKPAAKSKRADDRTIEQRELQRFINSPIDGGSYRRSDEYREHLAGLVEERTITADIANQGGFAVLQNSLPIFKDSLASTTFFRTLADVVTVNDAQSLGITCVDSDPSDAEWLSENKASTVDTVNMFGKRELHPHRMPKSIDVSTKFLRMATNGGAFVERKLGYISGITEEKGFLTGDGNEKPLGIFTASANGVSTARDVNTGHASTIPNMDCFIRALNKLPMGYRANAKLIMHQDIMTELMLFKTTTNEYIFDPSPSINGNDQFKGKEILLSDFAPSTIGAGLYVAVWADLKQYQIADVSTVVLKVLDQPKALQGLVSYYLERYVDGMPLFASAFSRIKVSA